MEPANSAAEKGASIGRAGIFQKVLFTLACIVGIYLQVRVELVRYSWLNALGIFVLCVGVASVFFPMQTRRAFLLLFGQLEYVDEVSPRLEDRIRGRYRTEMSQLTDLGFRLLFFQGQTFPILRLLLILPAIIISAMFLSREVIGIHKRTRFLVGHPIFASEDRTTYAQLLRLGVMFSTSFQNGLVLISCNYGNDNLTWKNYVRHAHRGQTISSTWAEHQRSIKLLETEGNCVDREMSFEKFVNMVG
jgi:hypothetical protein